MKSFFQAPSHSGSLEHINITVLSVAITLARMRMPATKNSKYAPHHVLDSCVDAVDGEDLTTVAVLYQQQQLQS